jgi:hypothetical protein
MKSRFSLRTLISITTFVGIFLAASIWFAPGVTVTVRNGDKSPLIDFQVYVTGNSYHLGDIPSGAMRRCKVNPTSESHVEISYQLPDGTLKRHSVGGYLEQGYRGTVDVEIKDGEIVRSSVRIRSSLF